MVEKSLNEGEEFLLFSDTLFHSYSSLSHAKTACSTAVFLPDFEHSIPPEECFGMLAGGIALAIHSSEACLDKMRKHLARIRIESYINPTDVFSIEYDNFEDPDDVTPLELRREILAWKDRRLPTIWPSAHSMVVTHLAAMIESLNVMALARSGEELDYTPYEHPFENLGTARREFRLLYEEQAMRALYETIYHFLDEDAVHKTSIVYMHEQAKLLSFMNAELPSQPLEQRKKERIAKTPFDPYKTEYTKTEILTHFGWHKSGNPSSETADWTNA